MSRILIKQNVNKFGEKIFIFFQKPILVFSFKDEKLNENDKSETHSFSKNCYRPTFELKIFTCGHFILLMSQPLLLCHCELITEIVSNCKNGIYLLNLHYYFGSMGNRTHKTNNYFWGIRQYKFLSLVTSFLGNP